MATYHCHTHAISRAGKSGSALACAAYRAAEALRETKPGRKGVSAAELAAYRSGGAVSDATGTLHDYSRKQGVAYTEIVLPDGVSAAWARDREALWNAAEAAEKRKDARVAREWRVALPHELSGEERIALARDFAQTIAERYGVAADLAVHAPSTSGDQRNWHAHILTTTREIADEGFGRKAVLEWSNKRLAEHDLPYASVQIREVRMLWEERVNAHLAEAGLEQRVDHRSYRDQGLGLEPGLTVHVGQVYAEARDHVYGTERILPVERLGEARSSCNANLIREDPDLILDRITRTDSVFTREDVARTLHRFVNDDWREFQGTLDAVLRAESVVELHAGGRSDTGRKIAAVYTTRDVLERESEMLESAETLAETKGKGLSKRALDAADRAVPNLSDEQRNAVRHLAQKERLAIVRGIAGTGKTTMLSVARKAAETDNVRIVGAALSGKAARELEDGSSIPSRTLASLERSWAAGYDQLRRGDILVVDEAGMVGARQMGRMLCAAEKAHAKVVLVGDERQLQPIEAGAAFRNIADRVGERIGAVDLTEVRRQSSEWQRDATRAFGRGKAAQALDAYRERGAVIMHAGTDVARAAMIKAHFEGLDQARSGGREGEPDHVLTAYRNADVDALNRDVRAERMARGELGKGTTYRTDRGRLDVAVRDHVLLTRNDRSLGVANGDRGVVFAAEGDRLSVRLRHGATVELSADAYDGVRHGYAVTTHRAQGMTVDRIQVLAGRGMDAHLAYVAMTRQREGATLYGSEDEFRDYATLRQAVGRERISQGIGEYLPDRASMKALRERLNERDRDAQADRASGRGDTAGRVSRSDDRERASALLAKRQAAAVREPDGSGTRGARRDGPAEQQRAPSPRGNETPNARAAMLRELFKKAGERAVDPAERDERAKQVFARIAEQHREREAEPPEAERARLRALFQKHDRGQEALQDPRDKLRSALERERSRDRMCEDSAERSSRGRERDDGLER